MAILLESPWPVLLIGIAVEAVLAIVLLRTGLGRVLWAMIGVAVVMLAGLAVERLVVTDREAVENTLDAAVAAAEANDLNRVLACISPSAQQTRTHARMLLDRVEVQMVRISGLEITVNRLTSPPTAKATFNAIGTGRDRRGEFFDGRFAQSFSVEFRREGDRWLIGNYTPQDPLNP